MILPYIPVFSYLLTMMTGGAEGQASASSSLFTPQQLALLRELVQRRILNAEQPLLEAYNILRAPLSHTRL